MIAQWTRIIHSNDGTLTDFTLAAQNADTIPIPMVAAEDFIYIGQHFPFNNFFLDVNTVNSNASQIDIQIWDGTEFQPAVDVLDETSVAGVTLARSGVIQFSPDKDEVWQFTDDTSDTDGPTELLDGGLKLYNLYWMRIKFSADLSAGTILNTISYRFASTQQLNVIDPDLDQYLTSWETGKTDWDEQLINGTNHVIADFKARSVVIHPGQLLRIDEFSMATAYKTLSLIYTMLGPDLEFRRDDSDKRYKQFMDIKRFTVDWNRDAVESPSEVSNTPVGMMIR